MNIISVPAPRPNLRTRRRSASFSEYSLDSVPCNDRGALDGACSDGDDGSNRLRDRRWRKRCKQDGRSLPPASPHAREVTPNLHPTTIGAHVSPAPSFLFPSTRASFNLPTPPHSSIDALVNSRTTTSSSPCPSLASSTEGSQHSDSSFSYPPTPPSPRNRPLPTRGGPVRPSSSFLFQASMDLDSNDEDEMKSDDEDEDATEVRRLHHLAFDSLRRDTTRDGEGFVERLRRWEETKRTSAGGGNGLGLVGEEGETSHDSGWCDGPEVGERRARSSSPTTSEEDELGDGDDELEVTLVQSAKKEGEGWSEYDVGELAARLRGEPLEDFAAVREYQERRY